MTHHTKNVFKTLTLAPLALAVAIGSTSHAQEFSQTVFFGDSLSDTGRLKGIVTDAKPIIGGQLQLSFTTNPDPVWTKVLADSYGTKAEPHTTTNPQGTNYAVGSARSSQEVNWSVFKIPSTNQQITDYLTDNQGKTDPNALYAVWIGANDLIAAAQASSPADAQTAISTAVRNTAIDVETLNRTGAKYILVPNIPDLSLTPRAIYGESLRAGTQAQAQLAASLYNANLFSALNQSTANIIPANTFALLQEATSNAKEFGFENVAGVACRMPNRTLGADDVASTSLACAPANLIEKDANETYAFADDIHPSGRTHRILAQYYQSIINTPAQIGRLPQYLAQDGKYASRQIQQRMDNLDKHDSSVWFDVGADYPNNEGQRSGARVNANLGLDFAKANSHTGAYINVQAREHILGDDINADVSQKGIGLYHRHDIGGVRIKANVGLDRLSIDTTRHIAWDGASRTHEANATGRRVSAGVQGSYGITQGKWTYRPYLGVNAQQIKVKDLLENQPTLSTAMAFHKQSLDSLQGEVGLNMAYALSDKTELMAGLGYQHEFKDDDQDITAALLSVREYTRGFVMPVSFAKQNTTTAHVGAKLRLGDKTSLTAGISADHKDSDTDVGGFFGMQTKF